MGHWYPYGPLSITTCEGYLKYIRGGVPLVFGNWHWVGVIFFLYFHRPPSQSISYDRSIFGFLGWLTFIWGSMTKLERRFTVSCGLLVRSYFLPEGWCHWRIIGTITVSYMWRYLILIGCNYPSLWVNLWCKCSHRSKGPVLLQFLGITP